MTERTYSLAEAATVLCGNSDPAALQWLSKRLRHVSTPHLNGFRAQNKWRMTEADIADAIRLMRPPAVVVPEIPQASSMTRTSRRRLAS